MNNSSVIGDYPVGLGATLRKDLWWIGPLLTCLGLTAFGIYTIWAAFQGNHYFYGSYLSPFYSPLLFIDPSAIGAAPLEHSWFGTWPIWWPGWLPASPAFLILMFPGSFRATCYYYRKAYYRSFFAMPPGCAVGAFPHNYKGETALFLFQNLHRYALYFALMFIVILYYDAFAAFFYEGRFGIGIGTIVLLINATLLACYTCGCHSFRHLIGGRRDNFSCGGCANGRANIQYGLWGKVTALNERHMLFAWTSLFWVGFSDVYVRLVSMGIWKDFNTWGF